MDIKTVSKGKNKLEIELRSEDHTLANLIKELVWKHGGEATYDVAHPLTSKPVVTIFADDPKAVLEKVSKEITNLAGKLEKAL